MITTLNTASAGNPAIAPVDISPFETQKIIENHRKIACLLETASNLHLEAAKHYEVNDHQKATQCSIAAKACLRLIIETERADVQRQMDYLYV